jgi:hypothetical protein
MKEPKERHREEEDASREQQADDPLFVFYPEFADDWDEFSSSVRKGLGEFLDLLQKKYGDPEFLSRCDKRGKYWGSALSQIGHKVVWRAVYPSSSTSITQRAEEIIVLAVERL